MSKIIGTVKSISGKANITTGAKQVHLLKIGEALHENDIIQTLQANAKVVLTLEGGREITLDGNDQILLDESVFAVLEEGEVINGKALHQLIADKLGNPEETAAGEINTSEANAGAEYASRNDARGTADSSGAFSDDGSSSLSVNFNAIQNENFAPEAFDDTANAIEEGQGSDDQYNAPVVATGNVLANDTDDLLPNPPADLDVTAVTSNDSENPTDFAEGIFTVQGLYGTLELNAETGEYTYTVYEENKSVNGLNVGDSLSESFGYVVSDGGLDDSAILTITINGSNDAPVATGEGSYNSLNTIADEPTEGSAVKFIVETQAGETVTFNWEFSTEDYLPYNDFAFVGIDSSDLILLSDVVTVGNGGSSGIQTYSITFSEAGTHAITFGISDYGDTGVDSWLNVSHLSGGNLLNTKTLGEASEEDSAYTLTSTGATLSELDSFIGNSTGINGLINSFEGNESDSTILAEGNVLSNDTDVDNSHEQLSVISVNGESVPQSEGILTYQGMYGILEMDAKGNFTYTPYDAESETKGAAAVDALNIGDILQESFTYIISDNEEGGAKTDSAVLTVTINGTNDAPVATAEIGSSTEGNEINAAIAATGNVLTNATDVDNAELSVVSVNDQEVSEEGLRIEGTYGLLVINANGSYTYTPYAPESGYENAANTDALSAGEQQHDIFTYTISDNEPGVEKFATGTLDITITGTNDQPIVSNVSGTATETDGTQTFNGQLTLIDPDAGDTHTFEQTGTATVVASNEVVEVTNFSVAVDPDGGYRVNGNFDALAAGETATVTFTYTATDDSGTDNATSDEKTVTLTVTGTNDQPVVSDINLNATGSGEVVGLDTIAHLENNSFGWDSFGETFIATESLLNKVEFELVNTDNNSTFRVEILDHLGQIIASFDKNIDSVSTTVISIDSINLALQIGEQYGVRIVETSGNINTTWGNGNSTDTVGSFWGNSAMLDLDIGMRLTYGSGATIILETNSTQTISPEDTLRDLSGLTDLDTTDSHTFQLASEVTTDSGSTITDLQVVITDESTGAYSVSGNFDHLAAGQTATITFQYTATDNSNTDNAVSEPARVTLTVTGTNDVPTVTEVLSNGTITEASSTSVLIATNTFTFADLDTTDTHTVTSAFKSGTYTDQNGNTVPQSAVGSITSLTISDDATGDNAGQITWEYAVNDADIQYLAAGETVELVYTVSISDNHGGSVDKDIAITITGTNDMAIITGDSKGKVTEDTDQDIDNKLTASGLLFVSDVDNGEAKFDTNVKTDPDNTMGGTLTIDENGVWTYSIDNSTVQFLSEGEKVFEHFTVKSLDGSDKERIKITITGTNDLATITGDSKGKATEDTDLDPDNQLIVSGTLTVSDVDEGEAKFNTNVKIDPDNTLGGSLTIDENGAWTYTVANSAAQYLSEGEKAFEYFTVESLDGSEKQKIKITIIGTNDAPIAMNDSVIENFNFGGSNNWDGITIIPSVGTLFNNNGQLGIKVNSGDDPSIDNTGIRDEAMRFEFDNGVILQHAEIKLSGFNTPSSAVDKDKVVWIAIMGSVVVATGEYSGDDSILVIDTGTKGFDTLIIRTPIGGSDSDFYIDSIQGSGVNIYSPLTLMEHASLTIAESYLLTNDTDIDTNDILNITAVDATGTVGEVHLDSDGNVIYDPVGRFDHLAAGEIAHDTFTYTLSDGSEQSIATVTVNIIGSDSVNDSSKTMLASLMNNFDGGDGYDSVTLMSIFNNILDFDNVSSKLDNIEHLDLNSLFGNITLKDITPDNVANMTDSDHVLKISGEADDVLELSGFTLDPNTSANLEGYSVYTGFAAGHEITLHVDQDITNINIIP